MQSKEASSCVQPLGHSESATLHVSGVCRGPRTARRGVEGEK